MNRRDVVKALDILKVILKSGYILIPSHQNKYYSSFNSDLALDDRMTGNNDKIYLSVYPNGSYSKEFSGNSNLKLGYDGFDMTRNTFFLILNSKLKEDYKLDPGIYPN